MFILVNISRGHIPPNSKEASPAVTVRVGKTKLEQDGQWAIKQEDKLPEEVFVHIQRGTIYMDKLEPLEVVEISRTGILPQRIKAAIAEIKTNRLKQPGVEQEPIKIVPAEKANSDIDGGLRAVAMKSGPAKIPTVNVLPVVETPAEKKADESAEKPPKKNTTGEATKEPSQDKEPEKPTEKTVEKQADKPAKPGRPAKGSKVKTEEPSLPDNLDDATGKDDSDPF